MSERVAICGGPRTGKTTLAASISDSAMHTDDLISLGWSEASAETAAWMAAPGPWVIEGVAVARALRKALDMSAYRPVDRLIVCTRPFVELSRGQAAMAKGCATVLEGILPELMSRGVVVDHLVCK